MSAIMDFIVSIGRGLGLVVIGLLTGFAWRDIAAHGRLVVKGDEPVSLWSTIWITALLSIALIGLLVDTVRR